MERIAGHIGLIVFVCCNTTDKTNIFIPFTVHTVLNYCACVQYKVLLLYISYVIRYEVIF